MNHNARRILKSYSGRTRYSKGGVVKGNPVSASLSAGEVVTTQYTAVYTNGDGRLGSAGAMTSPKDGNLVVKGHITVGPRFKIGDLVQVDGRKGKVWETHLPKPGYPFISYTVGFLDNTWSIYQADHLKHES